MSASVRLRTPVAEDAPALVLLLTELGYDVPEETLRASIRHLASGPTDRVWVAESEIGIVGMISVHLVPLFHESGHLGRIMSLVVDGRVRGTGVGSALVREAEAFCWAAGCERIELTSGSHRADAHRLYERLGFHVQSQRLVKHRAPGPSERSSP